MSMFVMVSAIIILGTTAVVGAYTPPNVVQMFGKQVIRCLEILYQIIARFTYIILTESFTRFGRDLVAFMKQMVEEGLVRHSFTQYKFDEQDLMEDPTEDPLEEPEAPPKRNKNTKKNWKKPRPDSPARAHSRYNLRRRPKQTTQ